MQEPEDEDQSPYQSPTADVVVPGEDDGGSSAGMRFLLPVGRSGWAIVAGYLGLFSILMFPGPFAVLAGILGVRDIKRNPNKHGMIRAGFGIAMGMLGSIGLIVFVWTRAMDGAE